MNWSALTDPELNSILAIVGLAAAMATFLLWGVRRRSFFDALVIVLIVGLAVLAALWLIIAALNSPAPVAP